ncbi:MAG: hypothetical protein J1E65_09805 [Lachnospiraceae bacterium]|nr:hypothetical protein [Lachnospiraceae bacterium]
MRKFAEVLVFSLVFALCGCGNTPSVNVTQVGPYGEISISLPEGWSYEMYPADSGDSEYEAYGIHFYPENVTDGYVEIAYRETFGVCGTGLIQKNVEIAGNYAHMGTYDNNKYWTYISFNGEYTGLYATTYSVGSWWDEYGDQVLDILDTVSFQPNE